MYSKIYPLYNNVQKDSNCVHILICCFVLGLVFMISVPFHYGRQKHYIRQWCTSNFFIHMHKAGPLINVLVQKNLTDLHRALTSPPSSTLRMNWNTDSKRHPITQHQCWTSEMPLWLNMCFPTVGLIKGISYLQWSKSLHQNLVESNTTQKSGSC